MNSSPGGIPRVGGSGIVVIFVEDAPAVTWTDTYPAASNTTTSTALNIGAADANRHVIAGLSFTLNGATAGPSAVTIGGVSASVLAETLVDNDYVGFWQAAVPTGTTAVVDATVNGTVWNSAFAVATADNEVTLTDSGSDNVGEFTTTSDPATVDVDVADDGHVLSLFTANNVSDVFTSFTGVDEDTSLATSDGNGIRIYVGSAGPLSAETARTVTATVSAAMSESRFGVISVVEATGTEITGTGAISTAATTVSGTAERSVVTESAAVSTVATTVAGTAEREITGSSTVAFALVNIEATAGIGQLNYLRPNADTTVGTSNPLSTVETTMPQRVRYRYKKENADSTINLTVRLVEGASTVIATWTHNDISTTVTESEQTLTAPQVASITDYTDLHVEFEANEV